MEHKILDRSQQDPANCWALEDLYATPADWERDLAELKALTGKLAGFSGVFTTSADQLLALLQLDDSLSVLLDKLANYAQRRSDEDTRIGANQELVSRITAAWVDLSAAAAFLTPELLELPDETLEDYYRQCPALEVYRWHIYNIRRQKAHTLSKAEERLLAAAGGRGGERALVVADHIEHALLLGADGEEVRGVERDAQHEHHARDGERGDADEPLAQAFNHGCFPVRTRARGWRGWSRSSRWRAASCAGSRCVPRRR